jgi:hypothetical protein
MKNDFEERGFKFRHSIPSGGKAGKGHNDTTSIHVTNLSLCKGKYFSYSVNDNSAYEEAIRKAKNWIASIWRELGVCEICGDSEPDSGKEEEVKDDKIKLFLLQFDDASGELIIRSIANVMAEKVRSQTISNYHSWKKSDLLGAIAIYNERMQKLADDVENCINRVIVKARLEERKLADRLHPRPLIRR